jgi:ribosome maturation factor RimP
MSEAPAESLEKRTAELLEPSLQAMGYELVRVSMGGAGRRTLQIMMERADRTPITVDDCADVSHAISAILDVEDPIPGAYDLEVSSPGLDRPLTCMEHFRRFTGFEARVELEAPLGGQKRFKGIVGAIGEGGEPTVALATETGVVALPFAQIRKAKLVLNDALLEAGARWAREGRSP